MSYEKTVTANKSDVAGMRLEVDREFDSVADAKAHLCDNYTTGTFLILDDQENGGAWIYNAE